MSSLLEIVELMSGEIVLQRADGEGEPLLELRFSDEASEMLGEAQIEVARAMIHAGIEVVAEAQLNGAAASVSEQSDSSDTQSSNDEQLGSEHRVSDKSADDARDERIAAKQGMEGIKASDLSSTRVLH